MQEEDPESCMWEKVTEPFTNGMDIVGYNYYEGGYEKDHEMFPERVMLGSENFPKEIGFHWPLVERLPYVIGEFTWTCWDYLGEAGIGKTLYLEPEDPFGKDAPWVIMPPGPPANHRRSIQTRRPSYKQASALPPPKGASISPL